MKRQDVELVERTTVYDGYFRIDRYRLRHALHAGGTSGEIGREVFERGHVAAVLPVDPARDEVLLIEQFRAGAYAAGWEPWLVECVAGVIEPGEDAAGVCRREAIEEAGCEIGALEPIARYLTSPGACSETLELFCGRIVSRAAGEHFGLAAESEDIRVITCPVSEAIGMLDAGRIVNSKTVIALHWLARNYAGLKSRWLADPG